MSGALDPRFGVPDPPKLISENLIYRRELIEVCSADVDLQKAVWNRCANGMDGCIYWFDAFVWTRNPKKTPPKCPMILWEFQEKALKDIQEQVDQSESIIIDKTREMGASWLLMGWCCWHWLFTENGDFLIGSRKKSLVDGKGTSPLLPKIDFILKNLPAWMKPPGYDGLAPNRVSLAITNPVTEAVIEAEATNPDFGRGGRSGVCILDEHGSMKHAELIHEAVAINSRCFISITTPKGRGTWQAQLRFSGDFKVISLHWTDHPEWQEGRYTCKPGCRAHSRGGKPHSKRYDAECRKLKWDPVKIAQELDIDYAKAGVCPFNTDMTSMVIKFLTDNRFSRMFTHLDLQWVKPKHWEPPSDPAELYEAMGTWRVRAKRETGGPLRIFQMPYSCRNQKCRCNGTGRHKYVLGCDVSKGLPTGDYSVIYVLDITTETVVAEWHGKTDPDLLAEEVAKLAKFYGTSRGGRDDAFCAVEWNDQGLIVNKLIDLMGMDLYLSRTYDKNKNTWENRPGVVVARVKKPRMVAASLVPEVNHSRSEKVPFPRLFNPFVEFWQECETVVSSAVKGELTPDERRIGATYGCHDDRVMAMVHAIMGAMQSEGKCCDVVDVQWLQQMAA